MNFKTNKTHTVTVLILTALLFFFSCEEEKKSQNKETTENTEELQINTNDYKATTVDTTDNFIAIVYRNTLNNVTDINVTLKKKGTFVYYQAPLSKPTSGEAPKTTTFTGTWTKRNHWIVLKFEDRDVKASTIFITDTNQEQHVKVIDDSTVEIDSNQKEISILGIPCVKSIIQ